MAVNESLTAKVRAALSHLPNVVEKKMFGGIAFMLNDKMCIAVGDDELMLRIDPDAYEEALQKRGTRPVIMKGRVYKGYVYVKEEVLIRKKGFDDWVNLALAFNPQAKSSKKKP